MIRPLRIEQLVGKRIRDILATNVAIIIILDDGQKLVFRQEELPTGLEKYEKVLTLREGESVIACTRQLYNGTQPHQGI